jgi:hypothetical protein
MLSYASLDQVYIILLLALLEAWRFLLSDILAVEEVEGGVRERIKERVLISDDSTIFQTAVRVHLLVTHNQDYS